MLHLHRWAVSGHKLDYFSHFRNVISNNPPRSPLARVIMTHCVLKLICDSLLNWKLHKTKRNEYLIDNKEEHLVALTVRSVFCKKVILKHFAKFTGKYLFFNKVSLF